MKNPRFASTLNSLLKGILALSMVAAFTVPLFLIGRDVLGEGVIALIYLLPVTWSASRWGLIPGICAALSAALCFDFLFIPPFYSFTVGNLEGWLMLAIFLGVAFIVVERFQASLTQAHEVTLMYELSALLSTLRTQDAVAHTVARYIQQLFQANQVNVVYRSEGSSTNIRVEQPADIEGKGRPDRILPILNDLGLVGEIQIWRGPYRELPSADSPLLQNFTSQAARAFARTQPYQVEQGISGLELKASAK